MRVVDVLWWCDRLSSCEHAALDHADDGWSLTGVATLLIGDRPGHVRWRVDTDAVWRTRAVDAVVVSPERELSFAIQADGRGRWTLAGEPRDELEGCIDVDLGWTPATNTLAIRRLDLATGGEATIPVAFLRFPELTLERSEQTYSRLAVDRWRYRSARYDFELATDPATGIVTRYGDDLWHALAVTARA